MRTVFIQHEDVGMQKVLDDTYDELLAALKERSPKAQSLVEDEEYSQLHDLLALLRLGHIKIGHAEDDDGCFIILEIEG